MKKIRFTDGWKFGFQGKEMKPVFLPHDAMLLSKRGKDAASTSGGAFFYGDIYSYEKEWFVEEELRGQKLILHFEGVYRNTTVWLNGKVVCKKKYGYAPFWIDVTDDVIVGANNLLKVEADNHETPNSRWYSGGGIYRPVWLYVGDRQAIMPYDVKIKTVSIEEPAIRVHADSDAKLKFSVLDGERVVAASVENDAVIVIPNGNLWDDEHPYLYRLRTEILDNNGEQVIDEVMTEFGIRTIECSPKGLFVNGKETLLRGGCVHSDNGVIGSASFKEAEYRKVKLLKDAGFNAIRSAHNPGSPALLEACDHYGMYVMDEGWDMWYKRKSAHDYGKDFMDHWREDIEAMVRTDYNHPSVIMYSIGNEVSEPATEDGIQLGGELAAEFKRLDPTRLTTIGCNITILSASRSGNDTFHPDSGSTTGEDPFAGKELDSTAFNEMIAGFGGIMEKAALTPEADEASSPVFSKLDVAGYNYAVGRYEMEGKLHPERVIVGAETFPGYIWDNWKLVKELPYVIGDFMWTAIDYIGEVGLGAWSYDADGIGFHKPYPWLLAESGALDLLGNPTGEVYLANAAWGQINEPKIGVSPDVCHSGIVPAKGGWRGNNDIASWSFEGCDGNKTTVTVYTTDTMAELMLNGRSLGKQKVTDGTAVFQVAYEPGELCAVSYDVEGKETGRSSLISATGEKRVSVVKKEPLSDDHEITYFDVKIVGENGMVEANKDQKICLNIVGGELIGFGSARARSEESFVSGEYTTYYGNALAAVRVTDDLAFKITAEVIVEG